MLQRANLRELAGDLVGAEAEYRAVLDLKEEMQVHHARVRPLMGLARIGLSTGNLCEAAEYASAALQEYSGDREALHCLVSLFHVDGGAQSVRSFARDYREAIGDTVELRLTLGEHAMAQGDYDWAVVELADAAGMPPRGWPAVLLAQALALLGKHKLSRDVAAVVADHYAEAKALAQPVLAGAAPA